MIDIDKMNDCLVVAQTSGRAQDIMKKTFDAISDFSSNHMTDATGKLLKESGGEL